MKLFVLGSLAWQISSNWYFQRNVGFALKGLKHLNTVLCHTCITRWLGRGGVGITWFSNMHVRLTRPAVYKRSKQCVFEKNRVMFTPHIHQFRGIWGHKRERATKFPLMYDYTKTFGMRQSHCNQDLLLCILTILVAKFWRPFMNYSMFFFHTRKSVNCYR